MDNHRFPKATRAALISGILVAMIAFLGNQAFAYDRQAACNYAQKYWNKVCSDGYFFKDTSTATHLGGGTSVPRDIFGYDCAHFVSCCIGTEQHEQGGGLEVPHNYSYTIYGYVSAPKLVKWLLRHGGTEKTSITELSPGDVIAYDRDGDGTIDHVALYLGDGKVVAHSQTWYGDWHLEYNYKDFTFIHMPTSVSPTPSYPSSGLAAYYPFDGTCTDASGNNNHGLPVGAVSFTPGIVGSALKLYGVANPGYVKVADSSSLHFGTELTVCFFLRVDGSYGQTGADCSGRAVDLASQTVFAKRGDRKGLYLLVRFGKGHTKLTSEFLTEGPGLPQAGSMHSISYQRGRWIHITYVVDSRDITLYLDGRRISSERRGSLDFSVSRAEDLYIGIQNNAGYACLDFWYPLDGAIDEMRFYNSALSPSEIRALAEGVPPIPPDPTPPIPIDLRTILLYILGALLGVLILRLRSML